MSTLVDVACLLGAIGVAMFLIHVVCWVLFIPIAARTFGNAVWLPADFSKPYCDGESVEFYTANGHRLEGTYLRTHAAHRLGVIAFFHELNGDRWSATPYTDHLRKRGYDIFTFDFRCHGTSERIDGYQPLPWVTDFDVADARAAIEYLYSRDDADPEGIGVLGVSKGGTAALCAAGNDPRVRTLVLDGLVPTERVQLHYIRYLMKFQLKRPWLLSWLPDWSYRFTNALTRKVVERRSNCRFVNIDRAARRIRQPMMIIHGQCDRCIPVEVVRCLRNTMTNRVRLWTIPKAKHNCAIAVAEATYKRRVAHFFRLNLVDPPQNQPARRPIRDPLRPVLDRIDALRSVLS